jgi:hypothetical protein
MFEKKEIKANKTDAHITLIKFANGELQLHDFVN